MPRKRKEMPRMSIQLVSLPVPRGGYCYLCDDPDCVVVCADTSIGYHLCAECADGALAIEKKLCLMFPPMGIRHPFPHERFPPRFIGL